MGLSVPLTLGLMRIELIGIGVLALVVSRTLSVVATTLLVNIFREDRIAMSYQIIMSFSGLRGAVAFYLALNVSSEFKNLIVTTTIGLIIITIVCFGGTTTWLLKAMAKYFPEDGIFYNEEEELLLRGERGYSDMSESFYDKNFQEDRPRGVSQDKSIGVITRLERIDMDYGRRYLRKEGYVEGWNDFFDNDSQYGGDVQDVKNSVRNNSRLYDDLSNYQASVRHYMECSAANLPYEDRKSVRLSMVSERRNAKPDQSKFLHVNRRRQGVVWEDYSNNLNLSRRGQSLHQAMRQEQMSIMSEPRGFNPGLRGFDAYLHDKNIRLNVPPNVIQIAKLDDISSKGSNGDSKHARNRSKDLVGQPDNRDNKDSDKVADPKSEGSQLLDSTTNLTTDKVKSRPRVTF